MAIDDPQQLSREDFQILASFGPTGITNDQYAQMVKAAEDIKGRAYAEGRRAEYENRRTHKELTQDVTNA